MRRFTFLKKDCWFIAFALLVCVGQASAQSVSLMHVPDSGRTQGLIFGQGTEIVVDVSQTGMTQSVNAIQIAFEFDTSVLTLTAPTGWLLQGGDTVTLLSITAAPVPASVRFTFTTKVDVTGREFSIGIKTVTLDQVTLTPSAMVSFNTVRPQLHLDTQIESPAENNNVLTLKATEGDTVKFQLFVPDAAGYQFNAFEVELALSGKTASDYISSASSDWVSTGSGSNLVLSLLSISGVSVPSSGYMGQIDLSVTGALTSEDTLLVQSAELDGRQAIDVSNAVLTFTQVCPGDFDNNGMINIPDFLLFVDVFGTSTGDATYNALMDMDDNGMVGIPDFLLFVDVFGTTCEQVPPRGGSGSGATTVTIPDANLRAAIENALGKASGASITPADMARLTRLVAQSKGIRSLTGLEYATNLTELDLGGEDFVNGEWVNSNDISNLSPLSNLTNLTGLILGGNSISDISALSNLTNLTVLDLGVNSISDVSALSSLTNLEGLYLGENSISDLSPLVANTGLSSGDEVFVRNNPLSATSINTHIPALQGRGVVVEFDTRRVVWGAYLAGERLDATQMALLPGLFSTALEFGLTEELDTALTRLVRETPALPTSSTAPKARLAAEIGETLGPHEWPEAHPWAAVFPGLPPDDARRVDGTVTVDASYDEFPADATRRERHFPLGYYAPPSALVKIEVPMHHATGELRVAVGELYDHLGAHGAALPEWRRAPGLRREFPVADPHIGITNAYGGSIALIVPADYAGTISVTVRGAIPMAVYTLGESNATEWLAALDGGAPQAIIQKLGGIRFVISTKRARGITDPGEVSAFWDGFQRHHAELAGEPVPRAYESIWLFDPQVGWGYANALPLRINYPLHGESWVLVPGTATGRTWIAQLPSEGPKRYVYPPPEAYSPWSHGVDWWLFGHELGHQWQTEDWGSGKTYPEIGEVAVNLFTMYTLNHYLFGGGNKTLLSSHDSGVSTVDHAAVASLRWPTADVFERLSLYRQLIREFGWAPIKRVFHSYYDPAYPRSKYGGELDGFAIRFSAIVQRDMVGFFRHWEYPLSESAAATIRDFEFKEWLPPGW